MTKIRSLSAPRNPQERLQQLEAEIDLVSHGNLAEEPKVAESLRNQDARTTAPTHAPTTAPMPTRTTAPTHAPSTPVAGLEEKTLVQLLATPFPGAPGQGPFQAATVRMPSELWKRVGWVSSLTGRTKQDVIGEALLLYLEQLRAGGPGGG